MIENGVGYDPWVPKLLASNQETRRFSMWAQSSVLSLADNPHRWYNPADVQFVIDRSCMTSASSIPPNEGYFIGQAKTFNSVALAQYNSRYRYDQIPVQRDSGRAHRSRSLPCLHHRSDSI